MYTTISVVESIPPVTSRRPVLSSLSPVVAHWAHLVQVHARRVPLTRSIPVYLTTHSSNPPFLTFHGVCSASISDDRWDTCTALRTVRHTTTRIFLSILRLSYFLQYSVSWILNCNILSQGCRRCVLIPALRWLDGRLLGWCQAYSHVDDWKDPGTCAITMAGDKV